MLCFLTWLILEVLLGFLTKCHNLNKISVGIIQGNKSTNGPTEVINGKQEETWSNDLIARNHNAWLLAQQLKLPNTIWRYQNEKKKKN